MLEETQFKIGDTASFSKTVTECDIVLFAGISGDFNSVHINEKAAETSHFKKRIAHGMLVASYISAVLGTKLPGAGTVYLSQELQFVCPVFVGDTITANCTVKEIIPDRNQLILHTEVKNQNEEIVISGQAKVRIR